jgi:hypothetical protein
LQARAESATKRLDGAGGEQKCRAFFTNPNVPGHGPRTLASRTVRQGQTAPRNDKQYTSLGDFQSQVAAEDKPRLREPPNLQNVAVLLGEHKLEKLREFEEAAGKDLASTGPQTNPAFLKALLDELGKLKKIVNIRDEVQDLDMHMRRQHNIVHGEKLPKHVEECLIETALKELLADYEITLGEMGLRSCIDSCLINMTPWQMPVATYADDV